MLHGIGRRPSIFPARPNVARLHPLGRRWGCGYRPQAAVPVSCTSAWRHCGAGPLERSARYPAFGVDETTAQHVFHKIEHMAIQRPGGFAKTTEITVNSAFHFIVEIERKIYNGLGESQPRKSIDQ